MKRNLLKLTSLVMMIVATLTAYAYSGDGSYIFSCPSGTLFNPTSKLCEDEGSLPEGRYFKEYILYPNAEIKPACISDTESMCVIRWNNGNTTIYNNAITGARE